MGCVDLIIRGLLFLSWFSLFCNIEIASADVKHNVAKRAVPGPCILIPCQHGGTCVDGFLSHTCLCLPGYTGGSCEIGSYLDSTYEYTRQNQVQSPYLKTLPLSQLADPIWVSKVTTLVINNVFFGKRFFNAPFQIADVFRAIAGSALTSNPKRATTINDFIPTLQDPKERVTSYADYNYADSITISDKAFCDYRLSGPNPSVIRPATSSDLGTLGLDNDNTLLNLASQKQLFIVDYSSIAQYSANTAVVPGVPKYVMGSIALFQQVGKSLAPVCIQLIGQSGQKQLFYPDGPARRTDYKWEIAKAVFQSNDADYHEAYTHLGEKHLVVEVFLVATYRRLPPLHPVSRLLAPHFLGTAFINEAADKTLINDGGLVDVLVSEDISEIRQGVAAVVERFTSQDMRFPSRIKARKMDEANIPNLDYPYRDDGMLHWNALLNWVTNYINVFYADDKAVASDADLAGWIQELTSPSGGNVRWLNSFLFTRQWLVDGMTSVIFIGSVDHAAVNFPQRPLMQFTPAFPLAIHANETICFKSAPTYDDYMSLLPPLSTAVKQGITAQLLGGIHHTTLGGYFAQNPLWLFGVGPSDIFTITSALTTYQNDLDSVTSVINQRNLVRRTPYPFMIPANVPQSINI